MNPDNLVEKQTVSDAQGTDGARSTETVSLVEMGDVLLETKGYVRGLELGFTPRS